METRDIHGTRALAQHMSRVAFALDAGGCSIAGIARALLKSQLGRDAGRTRDDTARGFCTRVCDPGSGGDSNESRL
jgi:hypothetical protein